MTNELTALKSHLPDTGGNGRYIYCILCQTPKHVYIGQSTSVRKRLSKHLRGVGHRFTQQHGIKAFAIIDFVSTEAEARRAEAAEARRLRSMGYIVGV